MAERSILLNTWRWAAPWLLLVVGLHAVPWSIMGPRLGSIPGDLGDARFNNYILEHDHRFLNGQVDSYWDAPFMYPQPRVIAFSDNLLGSAPIYSLFRWSGADRETAFQLWWMALFVMNYVCCFLALQAWKKDPLLAASGAYIFAFGLFLTGHTNSIQVFPRFIAPCVVLWTWRYLSGRGLRFFAAACAGLVFQFYCGMYMGFMLAYVLFFFVLAYLVVCRKIALWSQFRTPRSVIGHLVVVGLVALALSWLMGPYLEASTITGIRPFRIVEPTIPQPRSWFFASPASVPWRFLFDHYAYTFPDFWSHYLFPGLLPWLAVPASIILIIRYRKERDTTRLLGLLLLALVLSLACCLNVGGSTLYAGIHRLPGFASIRSVDRIVNVEIVLFILLLIAVAARIGEQGRWGRAMIALLPLLVVVDNWIDAGEVKRFSKDMAQERVRRVEEHMRPLLSDPGCVAVAYSPLAIPHGDWSMENNWRVAMHIDAMLAAQALGIPCVNGYSGSEPGIFGAVFATMEQPTVEAWCRSLGTDPSGVRVIGELGEERARSVVTWRTSGGAFVCDDRSKGDALSADRVQADEWERFTCVRSRSDSIVLVSSAGMFLRVDREGSLRCDRRMPGPHARMAAYQRTDGSITLRAANGKYVRVDAGTGRLRADRADSLCAATFRMEQVR